MGSRARIAVAVVVVVALVALVAAKMAMSGRAASAKAAQAQKAQARMAEAQSPAKHVAAHVAPAKADASATKGARPKLLELGSTECMQCKKMEPIIAALKKQLAGKVDVQFINVYKVKGVVAKYHIELIPTQIFLGANGKELFRHTGVFPKAEVLAKMQKLGMVQG